MEARIINVPVSVPKSYRIDLLQQQLTAYAQQLIRSKKTKSQKKHYQHETLYGMFSSNAAENELIEDYLQEKYHL